PSVERAYKVRLLKRIGTMQDPERLARDVKSLLRKINSVVVADGGLPEGIRAHDCIAARHIQKAEWRWVFVHQRFVQTSVCAPMKEIVFVTHLSVDEPLFEEKFLSRGRIRRSAVDQWAAHLRPRRRCRIYLAQTVRNIHALDAPWLRRRLPALRPAPP